MRSLKHVSGEVQSIVTKHLAEQFDIADIYDLTTIDEVLKHIDSL